MSLAVVQANRQDPRARWPGILAGRRQLALMVLAGLAAVAMSPIDTAHAQSREVLLGTIEPHRPLPAGDRQAEATRASASLLNQAFEALDRGDVMLGRRRLEVLVERYPDTPAASEARQELGVLYRSGDAGAVAARDAEWGGASPRLIEVQGESDSVQGRALRPRSEPRLTAGRDERRQAAGEPSSGERLRQIKDERRQVALAQEFQDTAGDRVFFAETSAELGARARSVLQAQARWLTRNPDVPVVIEAHADDHGSRELDVRLAQRRGEAVRERLVEEGVEAVRITLRSYGRDRPVAPCAAPECAAQNRRVVTRVWTGSGESEGRRAGESPALAIAPVRRPGN
ncbi:MAG: OmpA family protein [Hyphomicrobiaceae bacterium]